MTRADPSDPDATVSVFRGGSVFTMNAEREVLPPGTGVVVDKGRITGLLPPGSETPAAAQLVEMGDGPVLPAFLDPHVHFGMTNDSLARTVDCHTPPRESIEDVLDALRDGLHLADARQGWLLGQGSLMHDKKLSDRRLPTRHDLDRVSTTVPIVVRCGGHVTVLNSKALELSGLQKMRHLEGSAELLHDDDGAPNGILVEGFALVPIPSLDSEERRRGLRQTLDTVFTANGVTYLGEISHTLESLEDLSLLAETSPIAVDAYAWMPDTVSSVAEAIDLRTRFEGSRLRIRGVKIFVDGGFSAMTAASQTPYLIGPQQFGELYYTLSALVEVITSCREAGLQLIAHTNGPRAQALVCEANRIALGGDSADPTTRLEHAGNFVPDPAIVDDWVAAGVSVVSQPGFLYTMGDYFPELFGAPGGVGRFPYRSLRERDFPVAASSDVSGSELRHANPLFNAWCAVERIGFQGAPIEPDEAIDVMAALEMQTTNAAAAAGVDRDRGSIEIGKIGDLVSLDQDPREVPGADLARVGISAVVHAGKASRGLAPIR